MSESLAGRVRLEVSPAWSAAFQSIEQSLNGQSGSAWHALRSELFAKFQQVGLPSTKHEDWRYTNFSKIAQGDFIAPTKKAVSLQDVSALSESEIGATSKLVFLNGLYQSELSSYDSSVKFTQLADILANDKGRDFQLVKEALNTFDEEGGSTGYVALNGALLNDGVLLELADNCEAKSPIEIVWITDASQKELAVSPRLIVIAGRNSKAVVVERFCSAADRSYFTNSQCTFKIGDGSNLSHVRIIEEAPSATHFSRVSAEIGRASTFGSHQYSFSAKMIRNEIAPRLLGSGSHVDLMGATVLRSDEHVDNCTVLDHAVEHCTSNELYKGIYGDTSRGVFSGTIIVREGAQKTNAIQNSNSIVLSNTATVDTKPQLKIWADDVRCTHGATVGQLDQEQLFYLRSRGIGKEDARNILLHAFLGDVLAAVENEKVREVLQSKINAKLEQLL